MLITHLTSLTAEPASILYIVTGAFGLLFNRLRPSRRQSNSSVLMHFCKKSTRESLGQINLT